MRKKISTIKIGAFLATLATLILLAAAAIVIALINVNMRQQALAEAESKALILLNRNLATHSFYSEVLKPRLFAWTEPFRTDSYFEPAWMSSTYAIREIDGYFKELSPSDYYIKDAAINARSPSNEADEYERAYLHELNADPAVQERAEVRTIDGQRYLTVLRRGEVLDETCLRCHSTPENAPDDLVRIYGTERSFNRRVGETISAISIHIPLEEAYAEADRVSMQLSVALLFLLSALYAAQFWIYQRALLNPVTALRDIASQIVSDESHLGAQVQAPFGRELAELAAAFNTMSSSLRQNRDNLEARIQERTAELQNANEQLQREIAERQRAEEFVRVYSERLEEMVEERTQELRDAQEQLVRNEKLAVLGQMAGSVGHELRNPLGVISNSIYFLKMVLSNTDDKVKEYLERIEKQVHISDKIVSDLLDFTRVKSVDRAAVSIPELIQQTLERFPAPENVKAEMNAPEDLPRAYADPQHVIQVLGNLTLNACQAMQPNGGRLVISTRAQDETIRVAVQDTGSGISPENMKKLFEPLFTTKPKGIGLGLAVCKKLIEANDGGIEVESELGKGSTFTIWIPMRQS